jgi:hypothetical protein
VNHAIRRDSSLAQAVEVLERAAMDLRAGRLDRGGRGVGAGQPDDLMAGADQLGDDGGTDEAGRTGDKNTRGRTALSSVSKRSSTLEC